MAGCVFAIGPGSEPRPRWPLSIESEAPFRSARSRSIGGCPDVEGRFGEMSTRLRARRSRPPQALEDRLRQYALRFDGQSVAPEGYVEVQPPAQPLARADKMNRLSFPCAP